MKLFLFEKPSIRKYLEPKISELMKKEGVEFDTYERVGLSPFTLINKNFGYEFNVLDFHYRNYFDCLIQFPFDASVWDYQISNLIDFNDLLLKIKRADEIIIFYRCRNSILLADSIIKSPLLSEALSNKSISWIFYDFILDNLVIEDIYSDRSVSYDSTHASLDKLNRIDVIFHILFNEIDRTKPYEFVITQAIIDKYSNKYGINLVEILAEDLNPSLLSRDIETALRLIEQKGY